MRKGYKDNLIYLGESDIASLTLRGGLDQDGQLKQPEILKLGSDGSYMAYFVESNEIEIPSHYTEVYQCNSWLWIYDDREKTKEINADLIKVYRAGEFGILIQAIGGSYK